MSDLLDALAGLQADPFVRRDLPAESTDDVLSAGETETVLNRGIRLRREQALRESKEGSP